MKYAKLIKLGGELIEAKDADYQDYYGILTCPECGEPVFLRKGHQRGETVFRPAFVHHKAIPEISACEMRVGSYSPEYVQRVAGEARNQRIRKLEISMWKYLKTSATVDYGDYSFAVKIAKTVSYEKNLCRIAKSIFEEVDIFLALGEELSFDEFKKSLVSTSINLAADEKLNTFLNFQKRNWTLHSKIAREALKVFLESTFLKETRERLIACMCNRTVLSQLGGDLFTLSKTTIKWKQSFAQYIISNTVMIFLTVDWISILDVNQNQQQSLKSRGFATLRK